MVKKLLHYTVNTGGTLLFEIKPFSYCPLRFARLCYQTNSPRQRQFSKLLTCISDDVKVNSNQVTEVWLCPACRRTTAMKSSLRGSFLCVCWARRAPALDWDRAKTQRTRASDATLRLASRIKPGARARAGKTMTWETFFGLRHWDRLFAFSHP